MPVRFFKLLFLLLFFFVFQTAYAQQDIEFHLSNTFLAGKNIIKVKRDFNDPYLWVLTQNSEVYRINSETLVIDDYTSEFSAYSNFNFIDIAGYTKDEVFIATSDNLLRYTNGTVSTITNADGLNGQIKSIGFDYRSMGPYSIFGVDGPRLFVSTNTALDYYFIINKQFKSANEFDFGQNGKYELRFATYKKAMLAWTTKDLGQFWDEDLYHVYNLTPLTIYGGYIYLGTPQFGSQLKTATYFTGDEPNLAGNFSLFGNQFWTTEKGLFQNKWSNSNNPNNFGSKHYLDNISINQISSIYGLASLGFTNTRENLLVATDEGLYVSNSKLYPQDILPQYEFYRYAGLGNKKINYLDVNAVPLHIDINTPYNVINDYCENGVWVGATDGLYLLRPDYTNYFDQNQTQQAIMFDGANWNENSLQLCPGLTTKTVLSINSNASIQWYKNGQELANQSNKTLEINSAGEYYAVLYDPCSGLHVQTNHLTVNYLNGTVIPFNYPDKINVCYGSSTQLKVPVNPDFQYQWYKDGILNGITTPEIDITESGKYKLEVNSCAGSWTPTKEVEVNFIRIPEPIVTPDKTTICAGEEATLSATVPFDATGIKNWTAYTYRWYKDGVLLPATTATIKATATGKYKVEATACTGNSEVSADIQITVVSLPTPEITSKDVYCDGETALLNTNILADPNYTINWYKDNVLMPGNLNKTSIPVSAGGSYYCSITSNLTASVCQKDAQPKQITFSPKPAISIQQVLTTSLCDGQSVDLKVDYTGGTIKWSTGETTSKISVTHSGNYKAIYTSAGGCEAEDDIDVSFLPKPVLNLFDGAVCAFKNETITLTAPAGFSSYNWNNGESTSVTYQVNKPQTVTLTVTDVNNCQATQQIHIKNQCPDVHLANTFTPNGDGVNDTWFITGLEDDPTVNVKVFNRGGGMVFESKGYANSWNGTFNGKKLNAGVYYYIITTKASSEILKGSVTIIF
jgi:gliding motility-associated-like protein